MKSRILFFLFRQHTFVAQSKNINTCLSVKNKNEETLQRIGVKNSEELKMMFMHFSLSPILYQKLCISLLGLYVMVGLNPVFGIQM